MHATRATSLYRLFCCTTSPSDAASILRSFGVSLIILLRKKNGIKNKLAKAIKITDKKEIKNGELVIKI